MIAAMKQALKALDNASLRSGVPSYTEEKVALRAALDVAMEGKS